MAPVGPGDHPEDVGQVGDIAALHKPAPFTYVLLFATGCTELYADAGWIQRLSYA